MRDANEGAGWGRQNDAQYELGGMRYPKIKMAAVASGSAEVDVKIIDGNRKEWETILIMGNMGMKVVGEKEDTVQSIPMWACCLKRPKEEIDTEPRWRTSRQRQ